MDREVWATMSVTTLKKLEKQSLGNDGVIDAKEATALVKAAGKDKESIGFLRDVTHRDTFSKSSKVGGKTAQQIVDAKVGSQVLASVPHTSGSLQVRIQDELSPTKGFKTEELARAAVMASGKTGAVLQDKSGAWRAYTTKAVATTEKAEGKLEQMTPRKGVGEHLGFVYPSDAKPDRFKSDVKDLEAIRDPVQRDAKLKTLLARSLGVSEDKINIASGPDQYKKDLINYDTSMFGEKATTADGGRILGVTALLGETKTNANKMPNNLAIPKDKTSKLPEAYIAIGPYALDGGIETLQGTYMHELVHKEHASDALDAVRDFRKSSAKGFDDWNAKTYQKQDPAAWRLNDAFTTDKSLDANWNKSTEFFAHGEEFMKTFTRTPATELGRFSDLHHMDHDTVSPAVAGPMIERFQRWASTLSQTERDALNVELAKAKGNFKGVQV